MQLASQLSRKHNSAVSRRDFARALQVRLRLSNQRAQGMPGARCTRGLVCRNCAFRRTRAYRAAETLRHPLRNGFTAYIALSPVERALLSPSLYGKLPAQLSASIAAPGPHDF